MYKKWHCNIKIVFKYKIYKNIYNYSVYVMGMLCSRGGSRGIICILGEIKWKWIYVFGYFKLLNHLARWWNWLPSWDVKSKKQISLTTWCVHGCSCRMVQVMFVSMVVEISVCWLLTPSSIPAEFTNNEYNYVTRRDQIVTTVTTLTS